MSKGARMMVFVVGCAAVAAGCGSTRFVVVDNQPVGEQSAPAITTPTSTDSGGARPATAADKKDFEAAFRQALTIDDRAFAQRKKALSGADDLEPTFAAVVKIAKDLGVSFTIDEATVDGDQATAKVTVIVSGSPYAQGVPVPLVREDGRWLITRSGACAVLALGSPCPDAPTG
jgi:hypothetical protein